jgi:hypothetical protein
VRPWLLAVLGAVLLAAAGVGTWATVQRWRLRNAARKAAVTAAREDRERVRVHVTPSPLPQALPLLGPAGTDADGYPLEYVDRGGLRTLLEAHKYQELTSYFEQFQLAFESDPRKEYWPADAGDAFASSEPEIVTALDAWVAATPDSFAPYLARGSHYVGAMWAGRGFDAIARTPEDDRRAMRDAASQAVTDLDRAIQLRPKLVAAMRAEMQVSMAVSDAARSSRMTAQAFSTCPGCLQVRVVHLNSQRPRWRGSYGKMEKFAATLSSRDNPRFPALGGFVDFDRAQTAELGDDPKRFEQVLADVDSALSHGPYWEYLVLRATALRALHRFDEALTTLDRADALRPMHPSLLAERAALHCNRKEYAAAGRDLLTALRIDPTDWEAKRYSTDVANGLLAQARELDTSGKHQEALDAVKLLLELCPTDGPARALYDHVSAR